MLLEFIIKYWIQWLFGIIALGLAGLAKHYRSLYKKNQETEQTKLLDGLHSDMDEKIKKSEESIMARIEKVRNTTVAESLERYNALVKQFQAHEEQAVKTQQAMFDTFSSSMEQLRSQSDQQDNLMKEDLSNVHMGIDALRNGVLSIQGRAFKETCRTLLAQDHEITEIEYEEIVADHDAYNGLGGNHNGDELFRLVQAKYEKSL